MSASRNDDIAAAFSSAVGAAVRPVPASSPTEGYKSPEDPMDDYRWYMCYLHPLHTVCSGVSVGEVRRKETPAVRHDILPATPTMLMPVPKYIPEPMDNIWIRLNMFFMQRTTIR